MARPGDASLAAPGPVSSQKERGDLGPAQPGLRGRLPGRAGYLAAVVPGAPGGRGGAPGRRCL